ncbi:hypothetical protein HDU96_007881 [Phlyctochytrium bullatum]|nr:hypothetical protein HDU96_007881 [Phlyctochytrium bullatum]
MSAREKRRLLIPSAKTLQAVRNGDDYAPVRVRSMSPKLIRKKFVRIAAQRDAKRPRGRWAWVAQWAVFVVGIALLGALAWQPAEELHARYQRSWELRLLTSGSLPDYDLTRPTLPRTDPLYVIDDPTVNPYLSLGFPENVHGLEEEDQELLEDRRYPFCSTPSMVEGLDRLGRALWNRPLTREEISMGLGMLRQGRVAALVAAWVEAIGAGSGRTVGGMVDAFFGEILEMRPSKEERNLYGRVMAAGGAEWIHVVIDLFEKERYRDVARLIERNVQEILLTIFTYLDRSEKPGRFRARPHGRSRKRNQRVPLLDPPKADLYRCARVNSLWASVALPVMWKTLAVGYHLRSDKTIFSTLYYPITPTPNPPRGQPRRKPTPHAIRHLDVFFDLELFAMLHSDHGARFHAFWKSQYLRLLHDTAPTLHTLAFRVFVTDERWNRMVKQDGGAGGWSPFNQVQSFMGFCATFSSTMKGLKRLVLEIDVPVEALPKPWTFTGLQGFFTNPSLEHLHLTCPRDYSFPEGDTCPLLKPPATFTSLRLVQTLVLNNLGSDYPDPLHPPKPRTDVLRSMLGEMDCVRELRVVDCPCLVTEEALRVLADSEHALRCLQIKNCSLDACQWNFGNDYTSTLAALLARHAATLEELDLTEPYSEFGEDRALFNIDWGKAVRPLLVGTNGVLKVLKLRNVLLEGFEEGWGSRLTGLRTLKVSTSVPCLVESLRFFWGALGPWTGLRTASIKVIEDTWVGDGEGEEETSEDTGSDGDDDGVETEEDEPLDTRDEQEESGPENTLDLKRHFEALILTLLHQSPHLTHLTLDLPLTPRLLHSLTSLTSLRDLRDLHLHNCSLQDNPSLLTQLMRAMARRPHDTRLKAARLSDCAGESLRGWLERAGLGRAIGWEENRHEPWEGPRPQISMTGSEMRRVFEECPFL